MTPVTRTIIVILGVCFALVGSVGDIQAQQRTPRAKAELWVDDYKNLPILIEDLSSDAEDLGLTEDRVQTKVELRLRQAGMRPRLASGVRWH